MHHLRIILSLGLLLGLGHLETAQGAHHWAEVKAIAGNDVTRIALINGRHFTNGQVQWVKSLGGRNQFPLECIGVEQDVVLLRTSPASEVHRCRVGEKVAFFFPDPAPVAVKAEPVNMDAGIAAAEQAVRDAKDELAAARELSLAHAENMSQRAMLRGIFAGLVSAGLVFWFVYLMLSSLIRCWWKERRMFHYIESAPAVKPYVPAPIAHLPPAEVAATEPAVGTDTATWRALQKLAKTETASHQR